MRDLRTLPKGHLHLHFELAMRPSTLADLAANAGLPTPRTSGFTEFGGFGEVIGGILPLFRGPTDFERLVDEMVSDAAAEGIVYLEPSFWPYAHPEVFGSADEAWETVLACSEQAGARHGVTVRWMAAVDRVFDSPERAVEVARTAVRYADRGIVALGLHNDENGWPPEPFEAAFRLAVDAGLMSTPHAGELDGPASVRGGRSRSWPPTGCSTGCGRSRIRRWSTSCANAASAWTSARPRTCCSRSSRRWPSILWRRWCAPVCAVRSTPTIRCCSAPTAWTSTNCAAASWD